MNPEAQTRTVDMSFTDIYDQHHPSAIDLMRQTLMSVNAQNLSGQVINPDGLKIIHSFILGEEPTEKDWSFLQEVTCNLLSTSPRPLIVVDLQEALSTIEVLPNGTDTPS